MARVLRHFRQLSVITNALNIAVELACTSVEVILTGGTLRKNSFFTGRAFNRGDLAPGDCRYPVPGVDGFDVHLGLTTPNLLEAKVNRVMMDISRRTVVVWDSSKLGRRSLSLIAPPSAVHQVITDRQIAKSDLRALREAGIEVTLV